MPSSQSHSKILCNFLYFFLFTIGFPPFLHHLAITSSSSFSNEHPSLTFEHFYQFGKNEYTEGNWANCVAFMLRALDDYRFFKDETVWCRRLCHGRVPFGMGQQQGMEEMDDHDWDLTREPTKVFMRVESSRALCLLRCRLEKFTEMRQKLEKVELVEEFEQRKPFNYLQFCYWKLGQLEQAVRAAFTFLVANPRDNQTLHNLHFYMEQPGFKHEMLQDIWQSAHERLYMDAVRAYDHGQWLNCANLFRQSLEKYWEALEDCRAECEDQLDWSAIDDQNGPIEWSVVLTSFYTSILRCRQRCASSSRLASLNGREMPNLLVSHFEYLHLCQFHLKHGRDACQSVQNALILRPNCIVMRRNKLFYRQIYGQQEEMKRKRNGQEGEEEGKEGEDANEDEGEELFRPTKEVRRFVRREEWERQFVDFVDDKFRFESLLSAAAGLSPPASPLPFGPSPFADPFDYSKLLQPLFTPPECQFLRSAVDFFPSGHLPRFHWLLLKELGQRIGQMHQADPPQFERIECPQKGMASQKSGCERPAISIGLDVTNCGKIGAGEYFIGCAVLFCEL